MRTLTTNNLSTTKSTIWVISLMVFVVCLSLFFFSKESLRLDESQSLWQTTRSVPSILKTIALDVHVPLYHLILHYWEILFGNGVVSSRMLSLVFFVLAIPAFYLLAIRAYEQKSIAIFAVTLFSISPFMNWYGDEIRMYSLFVLLSILSHYFFLGIYKYGDTFSYRMYALVALFGIYTHYFFTLVLLVQFAFFLSQRKTFPEGALKWFAGLAVVLAVAFSPWPYYVWSLGSASTSRPLLPTPDSINVFNAIAEFFIGFQKDYLNSIIISSWPFSVLVLFLALRKYNPLVKESLYFLFSAFVPILIVFIVSTLWRPLYTSRYLIFTAPALYLIVSAIIHSYSPTIRKVLKSFIVISMLILLAIQILDPSAPIKENYSEATEYLNQNVAADDIVILSAPFTLFPIQYYYVGKAPLTTYPEWNPYDNGGIPPFNEEALPGDIRRITEGYQKMWIVLSYDQGYQEDFYRYLERNYQLIQEKNFSKNLNIYEYQLRYDN